MYFVILEKYKYFELRITRVRTSIVLSSYLDTSQKAKSGIISN